MAATVPSAFASTPPPPASSSPPAPAPRPGMKMRHALIVIGLPLAGAIVNAQDNSVQRSSSVLTPKTQLEADEFDDWNMTKNTTTPRFRRLEERVLERMGMVQTFLKN
jgi:hypothetical protein